ncbi:MAG: glycosyltransferase [Patescibacteria group bacterium]
MITVVINTRNEENQIADCVKSAKLLSKDVMVVDMHSTDKTREIAESEGAKILLFPHTQYVEPARTFAIQECQTEWVFILDADERITKELAEEITDVVSSRIWTNQPYTLNQT